MYVLTTGSGENYAYPDICDTPIVTAAGTVPTYISYANISYSAVAAPYATTVYIDCMPVVTMTSFDTISTGDEVGTYGGLTSFTECGETMYTSGCTTLYMDCTPAQKYGSITGQNCLGVLENAVGSCIVPSQYTVYGLT